MLLHQHLLLLHELLLLLEHQCLLRLLPEYQLVLLVDELEQLLSGHGQYLVQSAEHEPLEVLVRDAQDGRSVRLVLGIGRPVEHEVQVLHAVEVLRLLLQVLRHRRCLRVQYLRWAGSNSVLFGVSGRGRLLRHTVLAVLIGGDTLLFSLGFVVAGEHISGYEWVLHCH